MTPPGIDPETVRLVDQCLNPLNAELNPICHLLPLLGGATIVVVSRLRVNHYTTPDPSLSVGPIFTDTNVAKCSTLYSCKVIINICINRHFTFALYCINTFAACYLNTQGLNNSCLKSPASTLVDLTFQSRALRSFSLNQLRNLSL